MKDPNAVGPQPPCVVTFNVERDMKAPVYLYYQLDNFYQVRFPSLPLFIPPSHFHIFMRYGGHETLTSFLPPPSPSLPPSLPPSFRTIVVTSSPAPTPS